MEVPFHYQFRIIVIGDTMVGKSCLLKTFSEGTFSDMEPTVGVDFFSKILHIKHKKNREIKNDVGSQNGRETQIHPSMDDDIIIKLQIWDTAGQERFKSIVTSYYRNTVGIILVYDITNSDSYHHLMDWFTEARRHVEPDHSPQLSQTPRLKSSNYPLTSTPYKSVNNGQKRLDTSMDQTDNNLDIGTTPKQTTPNRSRVNRTSASSNQFQMVYLVLGCKSDLEEQRQVSFEDGKAFADLYGFKFMETSSKKNHNVEAAFRSIAEEIYDRISLYNMSRTSLSSRGYLNCDETYHFPREAVRYGPLIDYSNSRITIDRDLVRNRPLLEAQPIDGLLGGCC